METQSRRNECCCKQQVRTNSSVCDYVCMIVCTLCLYNRMEELAKPIVRDTMDHVQFDPSAFSVSEAAKKAKASARIEELAQPITR